MNFTPSLSASALQHDAPICIVAKRAERSALIADMAEHLAKYQTFESETGAILSLYAAKRFHTYDIMALVGEARQVAFNEAVVAKEMSES